MSNVIQETAVASEADIAGGTEISVINVLDKAAVAEEALEAQKKPQKIQIRRSGRI